MICRSGEVRSHRVEQHRVREPQAQTAPSSESGADAGLSRVEEGDHSGTLKEPVKRVMRFVARIESLQSGVELEAAHTVVVDQTACAIHSRGAEAWIDRSERDEDVVVVRCALGDFLAEDACVSQLRRRADREHDRCHSALPIILRNRVEVRARAVNREVLRCGTREVIRQRGASVSVDLDVHMHVDRGDRLEVDGWLVTNHDRLAAGRAQSSAVMTCLMRV